MWNFFGNGWERASKLQSLIILGIVGALGMVAYNTGVISATFVFNTVVFVSGVGIAYVIGKSHGANAEQENHNKSSSALDQARAANEEGQSIANDAGLLSERISEGLQSLQANMQNLQANMQNVQTRLESMGGEIEELRFSQDQHAFNTQQQFSLMSSSNNLFSSHLSGTGVNPPLDLRQGRSHLN